jgi:hypothetical protein
MQVSLLQWSWLLALFRCRVFASMSRDQGIRGTYSDQTRQVAVSSRTIVQDLGAKTAFWHVRGLCSRDRVGVYLRFRQVHLLARLVGDTLAQGGAYLPIKGCDVRR